MKSDVTHGVSGGQKLKPEVDYAGREVIGARQFQEDYYAFFFTEEDAPCLVGVLCDGMGGEVGGSVASRVAVEAFIQSFQETKKIRTGDKLKGALRAANTEIANLIQREQDLAGMGTTLVGFCLHPAGLEWISVGDSPLYLYRNSYLQRLNSDHSMKPLIDDEVRSGKISVEDAKTHPQRNTLRSVVGGGWIELTDESVEPLILHAADKIIVASDGILTLSEAAIQKTIKKNIKCDAGGLSDALSSEVLKVAKSDQDNLTVLVVTAGSMLAPRIV